jgi:acetylornithine deacetylase
MDPEKLLGELVAIDSVNPDLVPGGAGETEIAAYVAQWLADAGLDVETIEAAPGRPSVVGIARGTGGGRSLMLNAHLDTVGVAGMDEPYAASVRDGRLHGRGAYDMKAGLAAIMLAGERAAAAGLRGDVIVTAVCDEEYASIGIQSVLERHRADACIVTEPTELDVCVAHKGFAWADVETRGRAAHGSRPDLGEDAIVRMGPALVALGVLSERLQEHRHPLLGPGSIHASLIEGGQELSSYPERCVLRIERRTLPGESTDAVRAEVEAMAAAAGGTAAITLVREPFEVDPGEPIVREVLAQATALLGAMPELSGHAAWMDAAFISAAGIPTVVFGPGGTGAHAVEEWADLDSLVACAEVVSATAMAFCA